MTVEHMIYVQQNILLREGGGGCFLNLIPHVYIYGDPGGVVTNLKLIYFCFDLFSMINTS